MQNHVQNRGPETVGPLRIADQGMFFVGGEYQGDDRGLPAHMIGQMYVRYQIPVARRSRKNRLPVVMIHGSGRQGTDFAGTPDDGPGWADFFLSRGWPTYVVDQPGCGRSPSRYTTMEGPLQERHSVRALTALLDRIGPAVLLTHSQSGPIGCCVAEVRPQLVKAILAVAPNGPMPGPAGIPAMVLEKNDPRIAERMEKWLRRRLGARQPAVSATDNNTGFQS